MVTDDAANSNLDRLSAYRDLLQAELDGSLVRQTPPRQGKTFDYISTQTAFTHANRIFGHGGWDYQADEVKEAGRQLIQYKDRNGNPRERTAVLFACRVTVRILTDPPIVRADEGTSIAYDENLMAFETARKGAVSDGIKRALRSFGPQFGLSLYEDPVETADRIRGYALNGDDEPEPQRAPERQQAPEPYTPPQFTPAESYQNAPPAPERAPERQPDSRPAQNGNAPQRRSSGSGSATDRITDDQLDEVKALYERYLTDGHTEGAFREFMDKFGKRPHGGGSWAPAVEGRFNQLTVGQARVMIKHLSDLTPF